MNEICDRIRTSRTPPPVWPPCSMTVERRAGGLDAEQLSRLLAAVAAERSWPAFAALFEYFGPRLKSFYVRGAMSAGQADDLVQETMMTVWRKAYTFDPSRAGAATWIFTIARNLRIDQIRRQRDPSSLPYEPEEAPPSQEAIVLVAESDAQIRRALDRLSDEQRTIVQLSYYGEKSQTEIAGELGIPLGTVKSRARLAMARLRTLLESEQ